MGTNYYLVKPKTQQDEEERMEDRNFTNDETAFHLGKSSGGWTFSWSMRGFKKMLDELKEELIGPVWDMKRQVVAGAYAALVTCDNHTKKPCPAELLAAWTTTDVQVVILMLLSKGYEIRTEDDGKRPYDGFWNGIVNARGGYTNNYEYAMEHGPEPDFKSGLFSRQHMIRGDNGSVDMYFSTISGVFE